MLLADLSTVELHSLLKMAISTDYIYQVYQPKFSAVTNELVGVESLVRWKDPTVGFIPPSVFVPIAEQAGLIDSLTRKVMKNTIRQCSIWNDGGLYLNVAINVSIQDLHNPDIVVYFSDLLMEFGVDPTHITFEITETAIMEDRERCGAVLATLRAMGAKLSVDDFGTGHASFVYLKHFPITEIKIDKMFVDDVLTSVFDAKLIRHTVDLAHEIGCKVVAEGIEDMQTDHKLRMMKCDTLQGYFLSKPVSANEIVELCEANEIKEYAYA